MDQQLHQQSVVTFDVDNEPFAAIAAEGMGKFHKDIRVQFTGGEIVLSSDERSADYLRAAWLTQLLTARGHSQSEAARARLLAELFL